MYTVQSGVDCWVGAGWGQRAVYCERGDARSSKEGSLISHVFEASDSHCSQHNGCVFFFYTPLYMCEQFSDLSSFRTKITFVRQVSVFPVPFVLRIRSNTVMFCNGNRREKLFLDHKYGGSSFRVPDFTTPHVRHPRARSFETSI